MRGYTQIEIGGKERPFKIGMNAYQVICDELGISINEITESITKAGNFIIVIYAGLFAGCKTDKIEIDFDKWDVGNWMDEMNSNEMQSMVKDVTDLFKDSFSDDEGASEKKQKTKVKQ